MNKLILLLLLLSGCEINCEVLTPSNCRKKIVDNVPCIICGRENDGYPVAVSCDWSK